MSSLLLEKQLGSSWATMLQDEIHKEYFRKIPNILKRERAFYEVYPSSEDVFRAYRLTPYEDVKVVIIGQDPYYNPEQANGLAFSVDNELDYPPSLKNIFTEIENDLGFLNLHWNSNLRDWATQGVLLINTYLTVRKNQPGSHSKIGWEIFTKSVIDLLNISPQPIVFMLWGSHARSYKEQIDDSHHCVLEAYHPSPLSVYRGFFGCKHFSKCNTFLEKHNLKPINWKTTL